MKIEEIIGNVPCIDESVKNKEVVLLFIQSPTFRGIGGILDGRLIGSL